MTPDMHSKAIRQMKLNSSPLSKLKTLASRSIGAGTFIALALFVALPLMVTSTAQAKQHPKAPDQTPDPIPAGMHKITEVDPASIKLASGTSGDTVQSYSITAATKVTLNGAAAYARDLKAGMIAKVEPSADGKSAVTITAQDPPAHPGKNRVG
jgi:hypothetical protein